MNDRDFPPCGCIRCTRARLAARPCDVDHDVPTHEFPWVDYRHGCEVCGSKRCWHHADHRHACQTQLQTVYRPNFWGPGVFQ